MEVYDDFTLAVALQMLQVEEDLKCRDLGKLPKGGDKAAAIDLYRGELSGAFLSMEDRRMAKSLGNAIHTDRATLMTLHQIERQEAEDRSLALNLAQEEGYDTGGLRAALNKLDIPGSSPYDPASPCGAGAAGSKSRGGPSSSRKLECVSCMDKFDVAGVREVPCHHVYCNVCLRNLCHAALDDRSLIPVRCCGKDIPSEWVKENLLPHQWKKYRRLLSERNQVDILKDLDPEFQRSVTRAGGKLCPRCGSGIELDYGCNHITCTCRHEFCFVCLKKWQTCECPQYSEDMLSRIRAAGQERPPQQQVRQQGRQRLCDHGEWVKINIRNRYEREPTHCFHCGLDTNRFYYQCEDCGETSCSRCRFNRFH